MTKTWTDDARFLQSLANLQLAMTQLKNYLAQPVINDRDRAGVVQAFEFTFELFWKTFQKAAQCEKLTVNTPLQAFRSGLQIGLIPVEEEQDWINMINDRNRSVHTYHSSFAMDLFHRIEKTYHPLFEKALVRLSAP